ncbi:MAG: hypothetical protein ACREHF_14435 [Rhizomicrobium sp.]
MRRTGAAGRSLALGIVAAAGLSLAGCGTIDNALFGATEEQATPPPAQTATAAPPPAAQSPAAPGSAPVEAPPAEAQTAAPPTAAAPAPAPAPVTTAGMAPPSVGGEFAPVAVAPGPASGTAVSQTIQSLRSQLEGLETKLASGAQRYADLRSSGLQNSTAYQDASAQVSSRLEAGTTRGNPELIAQWNAAQASLDSLTGNINGLAQLAGEVSGDASAAHAQYDTIQSTFDVSGAVDEDHRQLTVLSDETGETAVVLDRLLRTVKGALRRETAYVAHERGNLVRLASAIKAGDYSPLVTASREPAARRTVAAREPAPEAAVAAADETGAPILTIKFDRAHISYDHELYSALSQALATKPSASFDVVGVAHAGTRLAQNSAVHDARAVMRSMGQMGVPASRMAVSASSDPAISASEVRVYVK